MVPRRAAGAASATIVLRAAGLLVAALLAFLMTRGVVCSPASIQRVSEALTEATSPGPRELTSRAEPRRAAGAFDAAEQVSAGGEEDGRVDPRELTERPRGARAVTLPASTTIASAVAEQIATTADVRRGHRHRHRRGLRHHQRHR